MHFHAEGFRGKEALFYCVHLDADWREQRIRLKQFERQPELPNPAPHRYIDAHKENVRWEDAREGESAPAIVRIRALTARRPAWSLRVGVDTDSSGT